MSKKNKGKINSLVRMTILVLALVNNSLVIHGKIPIFDFDNETLTQIFSELFTAISALVAYYTTNRRGKND